MFFLASLVSSLLITSGNDSGKQMSARRPAAGDRPHLRLLYKDLVIVNASVESESLVALDRRTGEFRWRAGDIRESWNTPLVVTAEFGRQELIVAVAGKILAFDPDSGQLLWSCNTDIGWYMVPSVVAANGVVYCLGGRSGVAALAVRGGGSGDVTDSHRLWTSRKGSNVSSPVYHDGHLYWVHMSSAGSPIVRRLPAVR
jgi:outer membrane protein assembly factor BamB